MKKHHFLLFLTILIASLFLLACGKDKDNNTTKTTPELKICSSLGKETTELLVKDFIAKNKLKLKPEIAYIPGGTTEQRFAFIEKGNFDCWLGGTAEEYYSATDKGLLQSYTAKEAFKVPAELRNRRNLWTTLYLRHIAIISNKNSLHNLGLYAPTTWDELLSPNLKNEIAIPNFTLGGSSFGMLTSIWQMRGKEEALNYAKKFNQQIPTITNNALEAADLVYKGKKALAILPVDYALNLEEKHSFLFATVPKDANRNLLTGVALLKTSQNVETSQNFIDYLMSDASEEVLHNNGYKYLWHVKHYPNNSNRTELVGRLKIPVDDLAWTSTYKSEIIRQWTEAK